MTVSYLSLEEILRLHFQLIEDYGGSHGVHDEGRLKSVVETPKQEVFGKVQYETVCVKAAVYLKSIIADHPFLDDNKRTAVIVCGVFLLRNNHTFVAKPQDLENFAVRIATNNVEISEITAWLEANTKS